MDLRKKLNMESSIGFIVKLTEKSLVRALDTELKERCGLSGGQWKIIMVLAISEGINQKELAELAFVEGPTLVPIIDRMEKEGLVRRKADPSDRRSNRIYLTEKSKKMVDKIVKGILDFRKAITKNIAEKDIDVARTVLKKLSQNADKLMKERGIRVPETILSKK